MLTGRGVKGEVDEAEWHLLMARSLFSLVRLRAGAKGYAFSDRKSIELEKKRLRRYEERVVGGRKNQSHCDTGAMERMKPSDRFISRALWPNLTKSQKTQFKQACVLTDDARFDACLAPACGNDDI